MKTNLGDPHRNFVDFAHVPVVKRLTRLPVCIDPSHSVGKQLVAPDGLLDIHHVTAQGIIAGANMVLVDFHPQPERGAVRRPAGAARSRELEHFVRDAQLVRDAYLQRLKLRVELGPTAADAVLARRHRRASQPPAPARPRAAPRSPARSRRSFQRFGAPNVDELPSCVVRGRRDRGRRVRPRASRPRGC